MVAEADESDRSFLKLFPTIAVITNIDHEHLESYGGFADLQQAFVDFANKVPFYGAVVACADDEHGCAPVLPRMTRRVITCGRRRRRTRTSDVTATDVVARAADACAPPCGAGRAAAEDRAQSSVTLGPLSAERAGPPQPAERARNRARSGSNSGCRSTGSPPGSREFRGAERRFEVRGERERHSRGGRLRASSDRDRRRAGGRAHAEPPDRRGVSAAPVYAHRRALMHAFGPALAGRRSRRC